MKKTAQNVYLGRTIILSNIFDHSRKCLMFNLVVQLKVLLQYDELFFRNKTQNFETSLLHIDSPLHKRAPTTNSLHHHNITLQQLIMLLIKTQPTKPHTHTAIVPLSHNKYISYRQDAPHLLFRNAPPLFTRPHHHQEGCKRHS